MTEESARGLSTAELASLRAVLHHGSQEASTALQGWINKTAIVEIDSVDQLPFEEATLLLGAEDEPVCFCSMKLPVPISGELILAFDDASGLALADLALAQPKGHSLTWGEL